MEIDKIAEIILEAQKQAVSGAAFFPRDMSIERISGKATVLTGIRRCGKSTYEKIYMKSLTEGGVSPENICWLDFSDDRLTDLRAEKPGVVSDAYYSLFPEKAGEKVYFFFDEIQYLNDWELFLNRLLSTRNCEINVTGSSAKLLVKEIATEFSGRSLPWELFPFSFSEYLRAVSEKEFPDVRRMTADDKRLCAKCFRDYMRIGGFPESLMMERDDTRVRFLQNIAETVVFRDVIRRYNLTNPEAVYRLMQLLLSHMSDRISYSRLKKRLDGEQLHLSQENVGLYTGYFEDAYLIYQAEIMSANESVRKTNPKKIYTADPALACAVSGKLMNDTGKRLENIVYLELRRKSDRIYYMKTKAGEEIDFAVIKPGGSIEDPDSIDLIQVTESLQDESTRAREIKAMRHAMAEAGKKEGLIITLNEAEKIDVPEGVIRVMPAWEFCI